jgi:spore germination protein KA
MFKLLNKIAGRKKKIKPVKSQDPLAEQTSWKEQPVSLRMEENSDAIKRIYRIPDNRDVKFREIKMGGTGRKAAVFFISSITDVRTIEDSALRPLLLNKDSDLGIKDIIYTQNVTEVTQIKEVVENINAGNAVIFLENEQRQRPRFL